MKELRKLIQFKPSGRVLSRYLYCSSFYSCFLSCGSARPCIEGLWLSWVRGTEDVASLEAQQAFGGPSSTLIHDDPGWTPYKREKHELICSINKLIRNSNSKETNLKSPENKINGYEQSMIQK